MDPMDLVTMALEVMASEVTIMDSDTMVTMDPMDSEDTIVEDSEDSEDSEDPVDHAKRFSML